MQGQTADLDLNAESALLAVLNHRVTQGLLPRKNDLGDEGPLRKC